MKLRHRRSSGIAEMWSRRIRDHPFLSLLRLVGDGCRVIHSYIAATWQGESWGGAQRNPMAATELGLPDTRAFPLSLPPSFQKERRGLSFVLDHLRLNGDGQACLAGPLSTISDNTHMKGSSDGPSLPHSPAVLLAKLSLYVFCAAC